MCRAILLADTRFDQDGQLSGKASVSLQNDVICNNGTLRGKIGQ
jgi:hypothetical protein